MGMYFALIFFLHDDNRVKIIEKWLIFRELATNSMWKNLGINYFLFVVFYLFYIFLHNYLKPFFIIIIVIYNFYCLQTDLKQWFVNLTIGAGKWFDVLWPQLYYHISSVGQIYVKIILIWPQNDSYQI